MFKNHPKGLIPAALSNMGERFGYYIMNAVLVLFLCSKFGLKEETSAIVYSCFYAGIYVLSLVGGLIADKTQNYKSTIIWGLIVMTAGYVVLAFPIFATADNQAWLLTLTCFALFMIAFGNGLFKGNLQAIVGQLYDNPRYASQRDAGFQIFYVFINIGGVLAPFVAPMLRSWWLGENGLAYNASLPALCHEYLSLTDSMDTQNLNNLYSLITEVGGNASGDISAFCTKYLNVFNTGIHYSFIASVAAMLISLFIFLGTKKMLPTPARKEKGEAENYSAAEKAQMAKEIKQRMYALFAVLGIAIFFWFSFHQNGTSLSVRTRLREDGFRLPRNLAGSQSVLCDNPHSVRDDVFLLARTPRQGNLDSPQDRHRYGSCRHCISLPGSLLGSQGLSLGRCIQGTSRRNSRGHEDRTMGSLRALFLPDRSRAVHISPGTFVRIQSGSQAPAGSLPGPLARSYRCRKPSPLDRSSDLQLMPDMGCMDRIPQRMRHFNGRHVRNGQLARTCDKIIITTIP